MLIVNIANGADTSAKVEKSTPKSEKKPAVEKKAVKPEAKPSPAKVAAPKPVVKPVSKPVKPVKKSEVKKVVKKLPPKPEPSAKSLFKPSLIDCGKVLKLAKTVTAKEFPDADSVLLDDSEQIVYEADGTSITSDEVYEKVLTEKGKRKSRTMQFYYMLPYSTVKVKTLEVIKPDGKVVNVDIKKNSREMINEAQMSSNIYNPNFKKLEVTIPELEIGDIIHYRSLRDTVKTRVPDTWCEYLVLEYTNPILNYTVVVNGPKSLPLRKVNIFDRIPGKITSSKKVKGNRIIYTWKVKDISRIFREPAMPPLHTVVQRLLMSTIPDWKYLSEWYWNLSKPHLDKVTPAMRKKVAELTKGLKTRNRKIEAIFKFVSQDIRYMGLTTEKVAPGYEPHDVNITFENKYGVCRDKAALLVAMLRLAGFNAYPVLIHNGPKKDKEVPQPYFNHAICCVENPDGSYTLMDPTDENTKELLPSYLCNKSFLVAKPDGETLKLSPIVPARENLLKITTTAKLTPKGGVKAVSVLDFEGVNDGIYRGAFARWKPEIRKKFFEGRLRNILPGAKLEKLEITPKQLRNTKIPLKVVLKYESGNCLIKSRGEMLLPLPWMGTSFGVVNFILGNAGLEKRRFPMMTDIACGVSEKLTIDLGGQAGKSIAMPQYPRIDTDTISWDRKISRKDGKLTGSGEFLIKVVEFNPKQYLALKQNLKQMEYEKRKMPIFAKAKVKNAFPAIPDVDKADVLILSYKSEIYVPDKHSWTLTRKVKKKILTYAGKKSNAELKIGYNPVWDEVKLADVKVTNPDGKVHLIKPAEINHMDAGWVGSAPRYPPGKILVANLPGVDVGSVIEYTISEKYRKRPFFAILGSFRYSDPIVNKEIKLTVNRKLIPQVLPPAMLLDKDEFSLSGDNYVYLWKAGNQAAIKSEDNLPPWWSFCPVAAFSAGDLRDYISEVTAAMKKAALNQPQAKKIVEKLLKGVKSAGEKAIKIRDFVAVNIRGAGPGLGSLPLDTITPADRTVKDGYGNDPDRAVVLYAMLNSAGLKPEFVLASDYSPIPELSLFLLENPQPEFFGKVLVRFKLDGKYIYLNDTDQYAKLGSSSYAGKLILCPSGNVGTVDAAADLDSKLAIEYDIALAADGDARITRTEKNFGINFQEFHCTFAEMTPEKRKRYFQQTVSGVSQAAKPVGKLITDYSVYPGVEKFTVNVSKFGVDDSEFLYCMLPGNILKNLVRLRSETREYPYYRDDKLQLGLSYRIRLPENTEKIVSVPENFTWNCPDNGGSITYSVKTVSVAKKPVEIIINCKVDLKPSILQPENYGSLLRVQEKLSHPGRNLILLRKKAGRKR